MNSVFNLVYPTDTDKRRKIFRGGFFVDCPGQSENPPPLAKLRHLDSGSISQDLQIRDLLLKYLGDGYLAELTLSGPPRNLNMENQKHNYDIFNLNYAAAIEVDPAVVCYRMLTCVVKPDLTCSTLACGR